MTVPHDDMMLRFFFGEDAKFQGRPLYLAIVVKAQEAKLARATVLRGVMGFGHSRQLHTDGVHLPTAPYGLMTPFRVD